MTGRPKLLRLIRKFEKAGVPHGQEFWERALSIMGIELHTPPDQVARIPAEGPVVITANHPHGLIDGMVLAELVGRVRTDYKILVRSLLAGVQEVDQFLIPVPFPHEADAFAKNIETRRQALAQLNQGGVVVLFPSGAVASSDSFLGPAIERDWNLFTAKLIQRSGASVVPVFFPGSNSRLYQMANRVAAVLRQGLLLFEVVYALNKPQAPVIGEPIDTAQLKDFATNPRGLMTWLREHTLALGAKANTLAAPSVQRRG